MMWMKNEFLGIPKSIYIYKLSVFESVLDLTLSADQYGTI
jgi:hypothetical protein